MPFPSTSEFASVITNDERSPVQMKQGSRNGRRRTIKKGTKITSARQLESMITPSTNDDDDELANFIPPGTMPPKHPEPPKVVQDIPQPNLNEPPQQFASATAPSYIRESPYMQMGIEGALRGGGADKHLEEKLNYLIELLEEQKDEKTGRVIEELILYTFLGVFVIFVVDCFARNGKYRRKI